MSIIRVIEVFTCLLGIFSLCLVASSEPEESGGFLSYDNATKQLHFRCPKEPLEGVHINDIVLIREDGRVQMAVWNWEQDAAQPLIDRVTVPPSTSVRGLEVLLSHVTCYDSSAYTCKYTLRSRGRAKHVDQTQSFIFDGDVQDPVLTVEPHQARYNVGDKIQLTCHAQLGQTNNTIVWETRLPGEHFVPVTGFTNSDKVEKNAKSCEVTSTTSVTHVLSADDDNREWRCRLRHTNHQDVFVAAVQCIDNVTGCSEVDANTVFILVAVIAVLLSAMVISVAIMTSRSRKQQKRSNVPFSSTFPLSDLLSNTATAAGSHHNNHRNNNNSGNSRAPQSAIQERNLPPPPPTPAAGFQQPYPYAYPHRSFNHYDAHDDDRFSNRSDETPLKVVSPYNASSHQSSSVYISMSAIPPLREEEESGSDGGKMVLVTDHPERLSDGRDTEIGRSESMYSNKEAIYKERSSQNSSAASHESHVTLGNLKGWEAERCPHFSEERLVI